MGGALAELERLAAGQQRVQQQFEDQVVRLVAAARAEGRDWGQIGRALGVTRQAARQRFGML
jgi:hypothetical protein